MYQYQILADGIPWVDSDGLDEWAQSDVEALAELLENLGFTVEVQPVSYEPVS